MMTTMVGEQKKGKGAISQMQP